jgi:hypothetical protein
MGLQHSFYAEGWYLCLFRIMFRHITVLLIGHQFLTTVGQVWSQDSGGQSDIHNIRGWYNRRFEVTVLRNYLTPLLKSIDSLKSWKLLTTPVILYYQTIQLHTRVKVTPQIFIDTLILACVFSSSSSWSVSPWHFSFYLLHNICFYIHSPSYNFIMTLDSFFQYYLKSVHDAARIYQDYVLEY